MIGGLTCGNGGGTVTDTLPVSWTTYYTGTDYPITEEVSYIHDNDAPISFDEKKITSSLGNNLLTGSTLYMKNLPSGGYTVQVHAYTADASDTKTCGPYTYTTAGRSFIKLQ